MVLKNSQNLQRIDSITAENRGLIKNRPYQSRSQDHERFRQVQRLITHQFKNSLFAINEYKILCE